MRSSNWMIIVLIASLAVNLALAGFLAGRLGASGHGGGYAPGTASLDPFLSGFRVLRQLPEPRREQLRPLLREHLRDLRPSLREMRIAQRRINQSLVEEPFDAEALSDALAAFRTALLDSQRSNHAALVNIAGAMTAAERLMLQEAMTRPSGHRPAARGAGPSGDAREAPER